MPSRSQFSSNEEYNAWFREYRARRRDKIREYNRVYNAEWKKKHGYHNEIAWVKKYPERSKAHRKVARAVKSGKLFQKPCKVCGATKSVAHHPDYSKPLNVVWLCAIHHRQIHYGN